MNLREIRRRHARIIFERAVEAVQPHRLLQQTISLDDRRLHINTIGTNAVLDFHPEARVVVVAAGKASIGMATTIIGSFGPLMHDGIVVSPMASLDRIGPIRVREAGHPLPDERGLAAAREVIRLLDLLRAVDVVLVLLSGGASALLPSPPDGISIVAKQAVTERLLRSGAPIAEVNTVRKHLSLLKGGGLARMAGDATIVTLLLSDVVGDDPAVIGSGPTVADPSTFDDARRILSDRGIWDDIPGPVRHHILQGIRGLVPETLKPQDLRGRTITAIIGSNATARSAASEAARALGYRVIEFGKELVGEANVVGTELARRMRELSGEGGGPYCLVAGGETTVTVLGGGIGGRNQELCVASARVIQGDPGLVVLGASTDGVDGPTMAAGAIIDGGTVERGRRAGLSPEESLRRNDSNEYLRQTDDLLVTGPTGTNVMDLFIGLG